MHKNLTAVFIFLFFINTYAQLTLTVGQVYNYNIGDVFQYNYTPSSTSPTYITDTVISKTISTSLDTVKYTYKRYSYKLPSCMSCSAIVSSSTYSNSYHSLSSPFSYSNLSDCGFSIILPCVKDTIIASGFCGKKTFKSQWVGVPSPSVISVYTINDANFSEGLGQTYLFIEHIGNFDPSYTNMIYYNKSGITCGTYAVGINEIVINKFLLFPNPTNSTLTILDEQNDFKNSTIEIKNNFGQTVMLIPFSNNIDISYLLPGMYYLSIQGNSNYKPIKFLKK
jgi:hypothetical protein